jgi:hypothetical protein
VNHLNPGILKSRWDEQKMDEMLLENILITPRREIKPSKPVGIID